MATIPHENDVLLGRGEIINLHPGNVFFRSIVDGQKTVFRAATQRNQKRRLALSIMDELGRLDPPGRFLIERPNDGNVGRGVAATAGGDADGGRNGAGAVHPVLLKKSWIRVEHEKAVSKVLHRLREKERTKGGAGERHRNDQQLRDKRKGQQPEKNLVERSQGRGLALESTRHEVSRDRSVSSLEKAHPRRSVTDSSELSESIQSEDSIPPWLGDHSKPIDHSRMRTISHFQHPISESLAGSDNNASPQTAPLGTEGSLDATNLLSGAAIVNMISQEPREEDEWDSFLQNNLHDVMIDRQEEDSSRREDSAIFRHGENVIFHQQQQPSSPANDILTGITPRGRSGDEIMDNTNQKGHHVSKGQLDEELDYFLNDFSRQYDSSGECNATTCTHEHGGGSDGNGTSQMQETTLRQWMARSRMNLDNDDRSIIASRPSRSDRVMQYIKMALCVAFKLMECLIEAEEGSEGRAGNLIAPASIATDSVLLRLRRFEISGVEDVDCVLVASSAGDSPDAGTTTSSRLFRLGLLLYELLSGEEPWLDREDLPRMTMGSIDLGSDDVDNGGDGAPRKRKPILHRSHEDAYSDGMARLERLGMPHSIRAMVKGLMDHRLGELCGDDAYASLEDLKSDIGLMLDEPSRFLENIAVNPMPRLEVCDEKLYGREREVEMLEGLYNRQYLADGTCGGVIIEGSAGAGKTRLATHVEELTRRAGGLFLRAKFDQTDDVYPLATVCTLFDSLCDAFARDAAPPRLRMAEEAFNGAMGDSQGAAFLAGLLPNLGKVMPSCSIASHCDGYSTDLAMSLGFLLSELLGAIASHSARSISIFIDDVQFANHVSLLLIGSLLSSNEVERGGKTHNVFFSLCYRDDGVNDNEQFQKLRRSISGLPIIKLENISIDGVNSMVSDSLHLSPRITRPLASVLHHKTRGLPLFLIQLMESLKEQGYIYVDLSGPCWAFQLDKIMDLKIHDNVLQLLLNEMQQLPPEIRLGLNVVSCMGSSIRKPAIDILSQDLGKNIGDILIEAARRGYLNRDGEQFNFVHDKVQQAAYEIMSQQERKQNHMKFGLAICAWTMNAGVDDNELFFTAINQINKGGSDILSDPAQKVTLAALNLKAGSRAMAFSDFHSAFKLFKHGISFLSDDHWETHYNLSLDLFDSISEVACFVDDRDSVTIYTEQLIAHAKCYDDKLNGLYAATKALKNAERKQESLDSTLEILRQLGEPGLRPFQELTGDMDAIDGILQNTLDESIYNMVWYNEKKYVAMMKLYEHLVYLLHFFDGSLIPATSLRMVQLIMRNGLCPVAPLAFVHYGQTQAGIGKFDLACRLGGLAMKLLQKKESSRYRSCVIATVYCLVLWSSVPLQSHIDGHLLGHKAGMQSGDIFFAYMNLYLVLSTKYFVGSPLVEVRKESRDYILAIRKLGFGIDQPCILHLQVCSFADGMHVLGADSIDGVPGMKEALGNAMKKNDMGALFAHKIFSLTRALLFRQLEEDSLEVDVSDIVFAKNIPLKPLLVVGIFIDALISFEFARQSSGDSEKWMAKGEASLIKMRCLSERCPWNFEHKKLLLEAEMMDNTKRYDRAEFFYERSMRSAREHKFLHEEAVASELAARFFYRRGSSRKSRSFFAHAAKCFREWGATAVANRIESEIRHIFGPDLIQLGPIDDALSSVFAPIEGSSKKRQDRESV